MAQPSSSPQNTTQLEQLSLHPSANMRLQPQAQPDEGYSEDCSHLSDSDMNIILDSAFDVSSVDHVKLLIDKILGLPMDKRAEIAHALIPTLPNEQKEELKLLIDHLTHFDPAVYLPNEIVLLAFSYLTPTELLAAGRVSRAWRARAQDERLWQICFAREGWVLDTMQIGNIETLAEQKGRRLMEALIKNTAQARFDAKGLPLPLERRTSRKRGRDEAFSEPEAGMLGYVGMGSPDLEDSADGDVEMEETEDIEATSDHLSKRRASVGTTLDNKAAFDDIPNNPADPIVAPSVFQPCISEQQKPRVSWPYLYKHRRRLEANWDNGRYTMFQMPHPEHQYEGHAECVYTIQHTHRHLVSGSRDRTIRIWDLKTCRLKRAPLVGHDASVLCLQFDERPEHDIIVSGGSDAHMIVWKFSTGEILKKMRLAHDESVLNLRFDDRYIVTCSKDKTIKVWSRHALARDSPLIPTHVLQDFAPSSKIEANDLIAEFTLLTTLVGHSAAVNAVMIHDNTIVSASGDRTIKSWDLVTGHFKKSYSGHTKGIACVQFDGRRIVSGSSDNTVRIFDAEKQAEVACLSGHSNLVRTVQARFGDLDIVTAEELAAEARKADLGFYSALSRGMQPASVSRRDGGGLRNAGSSRPEHMLALGTKVPPGGGGSRWAKIVSGSYDESVIVWKKDSEGKWVERHKLSSSDILGSAAAPRRRGPGGTTPQPAHQQPQINGPPAGPTLVQTQTHHQAPTAQGQLVPPNYSQHPQTGHQVLPNSHSVATANAQTQPVQQGGGQHPVQPTMQQVQQVAQVGDVTITATQQQTGANQNQVTITATTTGDPAAGTTATAQPTPQNANANANAAAQPQLPPQGQARDSNRVFKLQFDARRIVCCSQNRTIVGWDFANGDPELERVGEWSLETA